METAERPRSGFGGQVVQRWPLWVLAPVVIMLLAWAPLPLQPQAGGDFSWQAALQMALHQDLSFGVQVKWTYGPLGFLSWPAFWETHIGQISVLYTVIIRLALATVVFHRARRTFGYLPAFAISLLVLSFADGQMAEAAGAMVLVAWALDADLDDRRGSVAAAALGAFAGFQCLNKLDVGVMLGAMAVVFAFALPGSRRNHCAAAAAGFLISLSGFWLIAGQDLTALPRYLLSSAEIALGYGPAMSSATSGLGWELYAAFLGLLLGLGSAYRATEAAPARQRFGLMLLWSVFWFGIFKEGFVREDPVHTGWFFSALIPAMIGFRWSPRDRAAGLVAIVGLLVVALANQSVASANPSLGMVRVTLSPITAVKTAASDVWAALDSAKATKLQRAGRAAVRQAEPLSEASLRLLGRHTVDVYPFFPDQAWGYGLNWDPIPVLLAYSQYTTTLDDDDAAFLDSARAPQRIVYSGTGSIDGRIGGFTAGATLRALFCRYRDIQTNPGSLILARADNRCESTVRLLKMVRADWGRPVPVPALPTGRWMLYVRIYGTAASSVLQELASAFYKPPERFIQIDGGPPSRLVTGTASDGLLLTASRGLDYPPPFNLAVDADSIDAMLNSTPGVSSSRLTYAFYAQRIS